MAILYMSPAYVRVLPELMPVHLALLQHLGAEQGLLLGKLPVWVQRTLPGARCTEGPVPSDTGCCTTFVAMFVALASITQPETHAGHISQAVLPSVGMRSSGRSRARAPSQAQLQLFCTGCILHICCCDHV